MNTILNLLDSSLAVIGGADGPTVITVAGDLPLPAITVAVFAIGFIAYVYVAKAINAKKAPMETVTAPAAVAGVAAPVSPVYTGPVLTGIEEKEAAVIMAIVSDKTGIPLERLKFHSIKLMEDK